MNETCGCCEGIEKITPVTIANRPGLEALIYRVGTHASFLETMKARLSNLGLTLEDLDIIAALSGAGGDQTRYPLRGLTTRAATDPAIALLDAWAVVADVLTFYQERIANESYLRTATERRSILELARLVGYTLRPGVSASVFLAYTLEVGAETTILAGNRAQSLPGPGETPQSFETADKLVARAKWNNLQPRLTRPQFITQNNADTIDTIYFSGVSTGLKPNDPVLLVFDEIAGMQKGQFMRFVQAIEPQPAENRTKVTLQDIVTVDTLKRAIQQITVRYLDLPTFCVSADDTLAGDVMALLKTFLSDLLTVTDLKQIAERLSSVLYKDTDDGGHKGLQGILDDAVTNGDAHVANWLGGLINDLLNVLMRALLSGVISDSTNILPPGNLRDRARLFVPALPSFKPVTRVAAAGGPPSNGSNPTIASRLPDLVASLSKPASLQPATSQQLSRSLSGTFNTQSDILPQLLATLNPALKTTLYTAVSNATVTLSSDLQSAQALRVKAAPFGSNAPLRPITNDKGIVVDHTEWPIADTSEIKVELSSGFTTLQALTHSPQAAISVTDKAQQLSKQLTLDQNNPNMHVSLDGKPDGTSVDVTIFNTSVPHLRFVHALFTESIIVLNALPDGGGGGAAAPIGAIDIYLDGNVILRGIDFSQVSDYLAVPPGNYIFQGFPGAGQHSLQLKKAGAQDAIAITPAQITIAANGTYTLVATGLQSVVLLNDDLTLPPTNQVRIRAINYTVSAQSVSVSVGTTVISRAQGANTGADQYHVLDAGQYEITVDVTFPTGVVPVARKETLTLKAGKIYDVYVFEDSSQHISFDVAAEAGIFTGELIRYGFDFPKQGREFAVIGATTPPSRGLDTIILQVDDFIAQFTQTRTQHFSADGRNIILQVDDTSISLTDELLAPVPLKERKILALDAKFDQVVPGSWVVIERPDRSQPLISRVTNAQQVAKADYGITGNVTQLTLDQPWLDENDVSLGILRQVTVYAQSVERDLADETIDPVIESVCGDQIELDDVYGGLQSGRWLIVAGERTDILGSTGVRGAELVMLAGVKQSVHQVPIDGSPDKGVTQIANLPGDTAHTFLTLANALSYSYKRDTVTIYGNVVHATHGETRNEVLGSGDGSKELQQFALRQSPLTYLSAPTPAGAVSTLKVYVNGIEWHETDKLVSSGPTDRTFITQTDNDDKTTVIFGNGEHGTRLPTGVENVKATYRTGIGKPGNANARQISLLATRPLGVKSVINPLPATGGADKESISLARRNVPLAVLALDRLVSVQDYADFARTFAGIGKASAALLSDGRRQLAHLTIAGIDNIPIDVNSDLYRNLFQALRQSGDPDLPLQIALVDVSLLVIQASVHLLPDYPLELVEPQIRTAMLNAFGFEQRELGQPVFQSEVISVIQGVAGVDYVRLEVMGAVSQDVLLQALKQVALHPSDPDLSLQEVESSEKEEPGEADEEERAEELLELLGLSDAQDVLVQLAQFIQVPQPHIAPAQLAFLSSDVPDTLILGEILDERQA